MLGNWRASAGSAYSLPVLPEAVWKVLSVEPKAWGMRVSLKVINVKRIDGRILAA